MKGKKYIVTSEQFTGEVVYEYNLNGFLINFSLNISNTSRAVANFFYTNLPSTLDMMQTWIDKAGNFKVEEVPADLSFDRFWEEYGKHGTKSMAKKKYEKLKPLEQLAALLHLPVERDKKKKDGTAMPYAETYLNQKRWE
ncbi:hypothetical protein [Faecalibacter macacae]|uniref:Uncharacterized protein n=1 Tax=Faecalibacter macacae TaxID=1859289 RepID=A0A3L9M6H8_9FLAO|nr:hypothetical protein [Faecalibacter macacae]RLZ08578.1 hypothetical protein EAH69_09700 [Faecalibacter macacae]